MDYYIRNCRINKVRHLSGIDINLRKKDSMRHLILTGRNGSGKTSVLEAVRDCLMNISTAHGDTSSQGVELIFNCAKEIMYSSFQTGQYVLAYFGAHHEFRADIPKQIEKIEPDRIYSIDKSACDNLLRFMVARKTAQAFAITEGNRNRAETIQKWFDRIENILKEIYEDPFLRLEFDQQDYNFYIILENGIRFDFNSASDGFSAIVDIVMDLLIRMNINDIDADGFNQPGIVLIDELETHLHLSLQKKIFKLLTRLFPHIQFIVSTHSPFVLTSADNTIIYDLEKEILIENGLSDYSYSGIVESYFNVDQISESLRNHYDEYIRLTSQTDLDDDSLLRIAGLERELDEIPDFLMLRFSTEYKRRKLEFHNREDI